MENIFDKAKTIQEKREILKKISQPLKGVAKKEGSESLNQVIKGYYSRQGHTELKTIYEWNREGKRVRKGETALCLWGKPRKSTRENTDNSTEGKFFPLCFVFSNLQVE